MAKDKKESNAPGVGEEIQVAISKTEGFIEKYQKQIIYAVVALVLVASSIVLFNRYYLAPKEGEAQAQIAKSQRYFAMDSFKLALNGDGIDSRGFKRIIEDYGITETSNLALAYAGICSYKMGEYQKAIDYLEKFDANGSVNIDPVMTGMIGDSYVELNQVDKGLEYYLKASETENKVFSPVFLKKAGIVYESKGDYVKALEMYTKIRDVYFNSNEARDIDKYIERATIAKK